MRTIHSPAEAHRVVRRIKGESRFVGLVPTMGALHEGHLSLISLSRERADYTVVSIFVNPKQFGPNEDLDSYPRDEKNDIEILEDAGCDMLFMPAAADLYSPSDRTRISVKGLSDGLCGVSRPGHFSGVAIVVAKLFNIIAPDMAFFGQKDAQQAVIIQRMAADLDFPVRIIIGPTVRERSGLAKSSRNAYLTGEDRKRAQTLYRALSGARREIELGERDPEMIRSVIRDVMREEGVKIDYVEVVDGKTLRPVRELDGTVLMAVAASVGSARLIDNIALIISGEAVEETVLEFPEWSRYGG